MDQLKGKRALITGGSSGIGAATARLFAAEGARLVVSGLDAAGCEAVAAEISDAGGSAAWIAGDLADRAFCRGLVDAAAERLGGLDILINNAGLSRRGTAEEALDADWDLVMAVNLTAPFMLARAAIPVMRRGGGGVIVNTASELAFIGTTHNVAYCASKGAVIQLTRALALDHARENIRVNAICPCPVDTPLLVGFRDDADEEKRAIADETPMGRIGTPDEIAAAMLFLASDASTFMTGAPLVVDGGAIAH